MLTILVSVGQMSKHKTEFDNIRKQIRKIQREAERRNLVGGNDSMVSGSLAI